ncbi:MAG: cytochrome c biogenesis CcdA family protein [Candidatus Promineifilaceae bacterium]|nr:cytochrome c biogenesis CcdA family protein [Candidatus Promineifilaceae bacterium]
MISSAKDPFRSLSFMQMLVIGVVALVIVFLIVGSVTQSSAPDPVFGGLQTQPFLVLAFLSFFGGLLSFASPCTLPILPAYFAFAFQSGRRQIAANTMVFMLGLATTFAVFGAGASVLGRVLRQNQGLIMLVGGALVLIFGVMSLLGKGFTGFQRQQEEAVSSNNSLGGSYLFGLTFAVGWSSCVGPILGTVLTMAGTTASVSRGMMLLFIYALGLGLPLIVVSTFFGRASRQSLFWRILRGKGWRVDVPILAIGLLWALAIWRILVAVGEYAFRNFDYFAGQTFSGGHEIGLLVVAVLGVVLWIVTSPRDEGGRTKLHLHTTQLVSGALFILMGILLLNGTLASFNSLVPPDLAIWFAGFEERLIELFG